MATLFTNSRPRRILPFLTPIHTNTGDKAMDTPLFRIEHDLLGHSRRAQGQNRDGRGQAKRPIRPPAAR